MKPEANKINVSLKTFTASKRKRNKQENMIEKDFYRSYVNQNRGYSRIFMV